MPRTKTDEFRSLDIKLAELAKALAHPARIAILRQLAKQDECICGEIVEVLPLAQATVSQHLKALKKVGLIDGTIDGPRSCYCVNYKILQKAEEMLGDFMGGLRANGNGSK
jgi:DNA-binding transcriptional ArsR family regulator